MGGVAKQTSRAAVLALAASVLVGAGNSQEQSSAHQHPFIGPHGGVVEDLGSYNAELVVKGREISLFLQDHDSQSVDAKNLRANIVVMTGGVRRGSFALSEAGGNKLTGHGPHPGTDDLKAIITLWTPDGKAYRASYQIH